MEIILTGGRRASALDTNFRDATTNGAMTITLNVPRTVLTALAVIAWRGLARQDQRPGTSSAGVVTVFDHGKMEPSFAKAFANGGSSLLSSRTSGKGTYNVDVHTRESVKAACKPEGAATRTIRPSFM